MNQEEIKKLKQAGKIAAQVVDFAKTIVKKGTPLLEIAEKIELKIKELGGEPAFPVNLSIDQVAAHYTPTYNDKTIASGLLKVDIGVHINGFIADTAFSIDLENNKENQELIKAAQAGLDAGLEKAKISSQLQEIGEAIEKAIKSKKAIPIQNLSGHSIEKFNLHSGISIPNYNNSSTLELEEGTYAIEPFTTLEIGTGSIKEGKTSNIYKLENLKNVRDKKAREVLSFIVENYNQLPFCSRWLYNKFGATGILALRRIEEAGILHSYPQLIECSGKKVAQAEHTIILTKSEKIITTKKQ